jgi:hypothetical protein
MAAQQTAAADPMLAMLAFGPLSAGVRHTMRRGIVLAAVAILLLIDVVAVDAQTGNASHVTDKFIWRAHDIARGKSARDIERRFPLQSRTVAPFDAAKAASGEKWEIHSLTYRGIYLEEVLSPQQRFFLVKMIVSTPMLRLPNGLAVGSKRRDVERVLGRGSEAELRTMTYVGEAGRVVFHVRDDTVSRVEFDFRLD